jgi:hypothetical protein
MKVKYRGHTTLSELVEMMGSGRLAYFSKNRLGREKYLTRMEKKIRLKPNATEKAYIAVSLTGFGDAAIAKGNVDMAIQAYDLAGTYETIHVRDKFSMLQKKQLEKDREKMRQKSLNGDTEPFTSSTGDIYYHTSYGWFTDEQIKNLSECKYFNQ